MLRLRRALLPAAGLLVSVALAGCGGSSSGGGTPTAAPASVASGTATVTIQSFGFHPSSITVTAGTKVTWVQKDTTPHTVKGSGASAFLHSSPLNQGQTYTATFSKPGTYNYICSIHPDMHGTVIVQ